MDYWFTSDHHFGHASILKHCASTRPWKTVEEMDEALIEAWNSVVKKNDLVYHLGDFAWRGNVDHYAQRLNGAIVRIQGNHDKRQQTARLPVMHEVKMIKVLSVEGAPAQKIWLSHYAHRVWPESHKGSIHLFGHSHGTLPDDPNSRSMDVGVDTRPGNWRPYNYDEIKFIMAGKKFVPVDHHGEEKEETIRIKEPVIAVDEASKQIAVFQGMFDMVRPYEPYIAKEEAIKEALVWCKERSDEEPEVIYPKVTKMKSY